MTVDPRRTELAVVAQAASAVQPSKMSLINGAGVVVAVAGRPFSVMGFTVTHGKIVAIDVLYDPQRLATLDLAAFDDAP